MEKETKSIPIRLNIHFPYQESIEKFKSFLNELEKLGANEIEFYSTDYGGVEINIYQTRLETDEECEKRINNKKWHEENEKENELRMFYKIKEKYKL